MQKKKLLPALRGIFVLLLPGVYSLGFAASNSAVRSLVGVKTVRVVAEDLSTTMQKTGLRKEQLQSTAEEALRKNGFTVLSAPEAGKVPFVYIRLSSVFADDEGAGPISFYITLQVKQSATLLDGGQPATAQTKPDAGESPLLVTTWEGGTMAMVNRGELFFYIKQTLLNLIGDLAHDYQEANTKQVSRSQLRERELQRSNRLKLAPMPAGMSLHIRFPITDTRKLDVVHLHQVNEPSFSWFKTYNIFCTDFPTDRATDGIS